MMKILVISDTHSYKIPDQFIQAMDQSDLILHLGDFCSIDDYKFFKKKKIIEAVYGNMDEPELQGLLPKKTIIKKEGVSLGLFHGRGPAKKVMDLAIDEFKTDKVDAIIFGHSHYPFNEVIDNVLVFNPGSLTDKIFAPYRSYGILTVDQGKVKGEIIKILD